MSKREITNIVRGNIYSETSYGGPQPLNQSGLKLKQPSETERDTLVQNTFLKKRNQISSSGIGSEANFDDLSEGMRDEAGDGMPIQSSRKHRACINGYFPTFAKQQVITA